MSVKKEEGNALTTVRKYITKSYFPCKKWPINLLRFLGFSCGNNQFTCKNGECVKKNLQCDGYFACQDGSDEDNCECSSRMFQCRDRGNCLLAKTVCDGANDCHNQDDENNCRKLIVLTSLMRIKACLSNFNKCYFN